MTDPEARFRRSLHRIDQITAPVPPIDPEDVRRRAGSAPHRVGARALLAAAAAVVLLIGGAAAVLLQPPPAPVAATPAPATPSQSSASTGPRPTPTAPSSAPTGSAPTLPTPPAGYKWVDARPAEDFPAVWLAVPQSWGRGESWDADYCFDESRPKIPERPYVDTNHGTSQGHAITCPDLTARQQQPHVSVHAPAITTSSDFPWDGNTPGWKQWSRTIDGITVTVTAPEADQQRAREILDNVQVIR
jgi:hypothetical protein